MSVSNTLILPVPFGTPSLTTANHLVEKQEISFDVCRHPIEFNRKRFQRARHQTSQGSHLGRRRFYAGTLMCARAFVEHVSCCSAARSATTEFTSTRNASDVPRGTAGAGSNATGSERPSSGPVQSRGSTTDPTGLEIGTGAPWQRCRSPCRYGVGCSRGNDSE